MGAGGYISGWNGYLVYDLDWMVDGHLIHRSQCFRS